MTEHRVDHMLYKNCIAHMVLQGRPVVESKPPRNDPIPAALTPAAVPSPSGAALLWKTTFAAAQLLVGAAVRPDVGAAHVKARVRAHNLSTAVGLVCRQALPCLSEA